MNGIAAQFFGFFSSNMKREALAFHDPACHNVIFLPIRGIEIGVFNSAFSVGMQNFAAARINADMAYFAGTAGIFKEEKVSLFNLAFRH